MQLESLQITASGELESAFQMAKTGGANGLLVLDGPLTLYHRMELADLAAKYRLPAI
jgi:hypothetical protein